MNRAITNCNRIDCRRNVKRTYKLACQFHAYTLVKRSFILADWHVRFTKIHQSRDPIYLQIGMLDSRLYTSQEILYTCRLACQIYKYTLVKRSYILADWHVRFTTLHITQHIFDYQTVSHSFKIGSIGITPTFPLICK